jgi:hypothetical protein
MMSTDYNIKHKHHTSGNNVAIEIRLQCTGSRKKIQIEKRTKTAAKNWRAIRGLGMHSRRAQWKASILTISVIRYFLAGMRLLVSSCGQTTWHEVKISTRYMCVMVWYLIPCHTCHNRVDEFTLFAALLCIRFFAKQRNWTVATSIGAKLFSGLRIRMTMGLPY